MRSFILSLSFFCLAGGMFFLRAQDAAPAAPSAPQPDKQTSRDLAMISFLTPAQQEQYAQARAKALTDTPGLKEEGDTLISQASGVMSDGSPADKQVFMQKMVAHRLRLWGAMRKEDPTIEPVFAAIEKHISEMKAKQLGQVQNPGGNGGSNSP